MSPEVARFLLDMLLRQSLQAGAEDLEEVTKLVLAARRELIELVQSSSTSSDSINSTKE